MDTKMTTTTTTTITTTTATTTTTLTATSSGSKGVKRHLEEDKKDEKDEIDIAIEEDERRSAKEEKEPTPSTLLSRLKDRRADDPVPDADAKHPDVVKLRELIASGDCERVRLFLYGTPRTGNRYRLIERAAYISNELLWGEYIKTNLYGIDDLDHAKPFEGLHMTPGVFCAVRDGLYDDEDSESDTDSKSGGESKAPLEDEDGDEEEDDDEDADPQDGEDEGEDEDEGEGDDEEEDDSDSSSSDSDSDDEKLLDKQARRERRTKEEERRAKEQDRDAKRAEAYQDTKAQEAAEVKGDGEGEDDSSLPDRLSKFDAPLLRDSAHWMNERIMDRVILPWCHRVATTGGPMSRQLALRKHIFDIKEQYCDGFTSTHQVEAARAEALHAQAHGEDITKSAQLRWLYADWVGIDHKAGEMHSACDDGLKLVERTVKSYRKAAADSERKDNIRLELGQLCDQVLRPTDTLLCILREAIRFETQSRKLPLEISLLETELALLDEKQQAILPVKYEAYAPILGTARTEILHCLNPVQFPDRAAAMAHLNSLGIGTDKIQDPESLRSKSLAFVLALGRTNLEETYYRDPSIVSTFHYADYGCVNMLLNKRREWVKSLDSVRVHRMNERTLRTMCDNYNTSNQHSGLAQLDFKWVHAPGCAERLAPVIESLSDISTFVRALFESLERNKEAGTCCHQIDGCSDYLLNPLSSAMNERARKSIKDYIAESFVTKRREAADKREQKERNEKEDDEYDSDPDEFTTVRSRTARDFVSEFPDSFELAERSTDAVVGVVTQSEDFVQKAVDAARNERAKKRRCKRAALAATSEQDTESDEDMPAVIVSEDADGDVDMS